MARHADETRDAPPEEGAAGDDERDELAPEVRHPAQVVVRVALAVLIAAILALVVWAAVTGPA